jgi:hypothetical protein
MRLVRLGGTIYPGRVARALAIALLAGWTAAADAAPLAQQRVVLADPDPELRHAMEQALAPWRLEVVIEGNAPTDASLARERADADTARFVVWRDDAQLVVYDRELGTIERRDSQAGVLDAPTAAAAALTIKTMMRLPPPPPPEEPAPPPAPEPSGIEIRMQAQLATRISQGGNADASMRFGGVLAIRPWVGAGWRFGVGGDGGTATTVDQASFKGTWRDWSAFGFVSWTYAYGPWEIEPHGGLGIRHSTLDGAEMGTPRTETATLTSARGGVWLRFRYLRATLGIALDADDTFNTPTYMKTVGAAPIFQVPGIGYELGAVIALDL